MWAQEHKLEAAGSKRAHMAKRLPTGVMLAALVVGIARCPAVVTQATSQDPNGPAVSAGAPPTPANRAACLESRAQGPRGAGLFRRDASEALSWARDFTYCGEYNEAVTHYRHYL